MSEVKNETAQTPEITEAPKAPAARKAKEKMVKIRLPKTRENQDDEFVSVNNRTWLIKRGVEVEVPECVVEVLRNKELMLEESLLFEAANKND